MTDIEVRLGHAVDRCLSEAIDSVDRLDVNCKSHSRVDGHPKAVDCADDDERKLQMDKWKREIEDRFSKYHNYKIDKSSDKVLRNSSEILIATTEKSKMTSGRLQNIHKDNPTSLMDKIHVNTNSGLKSPSNRIQTKNEIIANKGKEVTNKKLDSSRNFHPHKSEIILLASQNTALRQRVSELEEQLSKCKRENESTLKQMIENNQRTVQKARIEYENVIDHLKDQIEEICQEVARVKLNRNSSYVLITRRSFDRE